MKIMKTTGNMKRMLIPTAMRTLYRVGLGMEKEKRRMEEIRRRMTLRTTQGRRRWALSSGRRMARM